MNGGFYPVEFEVGWFGLSVKDEKSPLSQGDGWA